MEPSDAERFSARELITKGVSFELVILGQGLHCLFGCDQFVLGYLTQTDSLIALCRLLFRSEYTDKSWKRAKALVMECESPLQRAMLSNREALGLITEIIEEGDGYKIAVISDIFKAAAYEIWDVVSAYFWEKIPLFLSRMDHKPMAEFMSVFLHKLRPDVQWMIYAMLLVCAGSRVISYTRVSHDELAVIEKIVMETKVSTRHVGNIVRIIHGFLENYDPERIFLVLYEPLLIQVFNMYTSEEVRLPLVRVLQIFPLTKNVFSLLVEYVMDDSPFLQSKVIAFTILGDRIDKRMTPHVLPLIDVFFKNPYHTFFQKAFLNFVKKGIVLGEIRNEILHGLPRKIMDVCRTPDRRLYFGSYGFLMKLAEVCDPLMESEEWQLFRQGEMTKWKELCIPYEVEQGPRPVERRISFGILGEKPQRRRSGG